MADAQRGMGRGLAAILPRASPGGDGLRQLPLELIEPNPRQPRRAFDELALGELADSIRARGVLQPIVVRPLAGGRYELVAGERRLRAAGLAGLGRCRRWCATPTTGSVSTWRWPRTWRAST